ncbi:MAG: DUF3137 domain-containing protein [Bacteroidota bacterium]
MKSLDEFKDHFTNEIAPNLNRLERKRKIARSIIIIISIPLAFVVIHSLLYFGGLYFEKEIHLFEFTKELKSEEVMGLSFAAFTPLLVILSAFIKLSPYKKHYKEQIIRPIIEFISPEFIYEPKERVSNEHISDSKTIIKKYNKLKGDDFVSGTIHGHPFEISEIKAEYKTKRKKDNSTRTVFHGLFFHSTIKKKFDGYVYLQPYIPRILQGLAGNRVQSDVVNLADMTISQKFVCYSNDDINARKILTPKLIELINKFSENHKKRPLAISIINDKLYVAIDYRKNLFEPKYFRSVKDPKHPVDYYSMLIMITNILDDLDLADEG